jgi:hypothetical protein
MTPNGRLKFFITTRGSPRGQGEVPARRLFRLMGLDFPVLVRGLNLGDEFWKEYGGEFR